MRQKLFEKLKSLGTPGSWEHIVQQNGMFSYTGLNGLCPFELSIYFMGFMTLNEVHSQWAFNNYQHVILVLLFTNTLLLSWSFLELVACSK